MDDLTLSDLGGRKLKSEVDAISRASRRWHNDNKNGGNFGINIDLANYNGRGLEIVGDYEDKGGDRVITSISISERHCQPSYVDDVTPKSVFYDVLDEYISEYLQEATKQQL